MRWNTFERPMGSHSVPDACSKSIDILGFAWYPKDLLDFLRIYLVSRDFGGSPGLIGWGVGIFSDHSLRPRKICQKHLFFMCLRLGSLALCISSGTECFRVIPRLPGADPSKRPDYVPEKGSNSAHLQNPDHMYRPFMIFLSRTAVCYAFEKK